MDRKKKPEYELPEEVRIVLECSPNLVPCKEFYRANIYRFVDHMKDGKCQQCIAWFRQTDRRDRSAESALRRNRYGVTIFQRVC